MMHHILGRTPIYMFRELKYWLDREDENRWNHASQHDYFIWKRYDRKYTNYTLSWRMLDGSILTDYRTGSVASYLMNRDTRTAFNYYERTEFLLSLPPEGSQIFELL